VGYRRTHFLAIGAFGDWLEDFAAVALDSESRYLDVAQARLLEVARKNRNGHAFATDISLHSWNI
jgi:hypothetical protein